MSLAPGTRIGSYEILASIGSGGMGQVYRARDTKLGREVAIKILPEAFAQDAERLARFEREARLLASLNHPNIATIHDLEDAGDLHFLVLELVPGETLAERISRGRVPVDEVLPLFQQIAEALEAAHEKGIIHRDLKPANIKVTPEGKVKVLDFGLAKAFEEESFEGDLSESPTATYSATRAGVIMGTAPYMSPEQARGKRLDKRTDIWSFGCCLYEALTGRKAFAGDTVTDTIAAVVRAEPDWSALPVDIPWKIQELLTRCLRKDPARRLCEMASVRLDIEDAGSAAEITLAPSSRANTSHSRSWFIFFAGAVLATAATAIVAGFLMQPEPGAVRRFIIQVPDLLVLNKGVGVALSPDGKNLVYVARRDDTTQLFLRSMDQLTSQPLPGTEGANGPFFSPDGQWIGFWVKGQLKKMHLSGVVPQLLCEAADFRGASWASDDNIYFAPFESVILRVPASGGPPELVTTLDPETEEQGHGFPAVLPGGKALLFDVWRGVEGMDLAVQSLETGERKIIVPGGHSAQYLPTGHIVFSQAGSLLAAPFDHERLEIMGSPRPVLDGVFIDDSWEAEFSLSADGTLVYVQGSSAFAGGTLVWVDQRGVAQPLTDEPRLYCPQPRVSPNGQYLALCIRDATYRWDIWVRELGRGTSTRLTFDGLGTKPIWSHDGERIIFASNRVNDIFQIFWKPADGSGEAEQLTTGAYRVATSLSSDGKVLIFRQPSDDDSNWDIGMLRMDGKSEPKILLATPFDEWMGMISPDGRWLAYVSNESAREEIYVRPFPGPGGRVLVSTDGGTEPMWARDGRELFYREGGRMMAVAITTEPDFTPDTPEILFEGNYQTGLFSSVHSSNYDVAPDGRHFVMIRPEQGSAPTQINVVLNWFEELKRVVPEE